MIDKSGKHGGCPGQRLRPLLGTEVSPRVPRFSELICIALWFAYYFWASQMPWLEIGEILFCGGVNLINKNEISA